METNVIHRAVGAALKAKLYFNAKNYIGQEMYSEAAQICQDIIDGVYGEYALATDWTNIFGWGNETVGEMKLARKSFGRFRVRTQKWKVTDVSGASLSRTTSRIS